MTTLHRLEALVLLPLALLHALGDRLFPRATAPAPVPALCQAQAQATAPTAVAPPSLAGFTVAQLRSVARAQLGSSTRLDGRRIAQARRSALLEALAA
jgi:hypothetical protein